MWLCEDTKILQGSHNTFPSPIITVGSATFPARVAYITRGTQSETTDDVMQTASVKLARTNELSADREVARSRVTTSQVAQSLTFGRLRLRQSPNILYSDN